MKNALLHRPPFAPLPLARTRTRARTLECIVHMRAYVCIHMHALLHTHMCRHNICTEWCIVSSARNARRTPRVGTSAGRVSAAAAGHSQCLQVGPVGRRRKRRELAGGRVPARQPCGRAERLRPTNYAHQSAARADSRARARRGRRPATPPPPRQRRVVRPSARPGTARAAAQRRRRRERARRQGGGGRGRTGSPRACIGRATRGAPSPSWRGCSCRAPRARAPRTRRATMDGRGSERASL
jgi:hypothetical protein